METENQNDDDMKVSELNDSNEEKKDDEKPEEENEEQKQNEEEEKQDEENNEENNDENHEENKEEIEEEEKNEKQNKEDETKPEVTQVVQKESDNIPKENLGINNDELINSQNSIQDPLNEPKKTLDETLRDIQNEISIKNQNIEEIDFKLGELSQNQSSNRNNIFKRYSNEDKNKMLTKLQNKSSRLQSNINALNKAQLKYENESFMSIPTETAEIMHREKLKKIKNEKSILMSKLNDISSQINAIVDKENRNQSKKTLIKNFLDNFESDKEKFSGAMMALSKEVNKKRKERNEERLRKEEENERKFQESLNLKEREKELRKAEFMNRQKRLEEKIKEKNNKNMDYYKRFIHGAPTAKDKNYVTAEERELIRKEEENQLLNLQLAKRKEYFKPISAKELDDFSREVVNNRKRTLAELEQKKIQLDELYKERKELLPKYHSQFYKINLENEREFLNRENVRRDKINQQKQRRRLFDDAVKKLYFPKNIDEKLKKQRLEIISSLKGENRIEEIKNLSKQIQKSANKYKVPQPKPTTSQELKIVKTTIQEKEKRKDNSVDYLAIMRKKREARIQTLSRSVDNNDQWEKMLSNDKNHRNLYDNIYDVQVQAEKLQKEAEFKTKLYKLEPTKYSDIRDDITNLYIDSIQAKLNILKKINEKSGEED